MRLLVIDDFQPSIISRSICSNKAAPEDVGRRAAPEWWGIGPIDSYFGGGGGGGNFAGGPGWDQLPVDRSRGGTEWDRFWQDIRSDAGGLLSDGWITSPAYNSPLGGFLDSVGLGAFVDYGPSGRPGGALRRPVAGSPLLLVLLLLVVGLIVFGRQSKSKPWEK